MYKIALTLLTFTSLAHATDPDKHDQFFGTPNSGAPSQHYVQPFQEVPVEETSGDSGKHPSKDVLKNVTSIVQNEAQILEDKSKLEWLRTQNHIAEEALRTEKKAQKVHAEAKKKSKKLKKKFKKIGK